MLVALLGAALGCGEDVMVGRWLLRSELPDGGVEGLDAGKLHNPQAFNAERARERARERDINKNDPHGSSRAAQTRH